MKIVELTQSFELMGQQFHLQLSVIEGHIDQVSNMFDDTDNSDDTTLE